MKVGDYVRCVNDNAGRIPTPLVLEKVYHVSSVESRNGHILVGFNGIADEQPHWFVHRFEPLKEFKPGDYVRCSDDRGIDLVLDRVYRVNYADEAHLGVDGDPTWWLLYHFSPATEEEFLKQENTTPQLFKVGDYVRCVSADDSCVKCVNCDVDYAQLIKDKVYQVCCVDLVRSAIGFKGLADGRAHWFPYRFEPVKDFKVGDYVRCVDDSEHGGTYRKFLKQDHVYRVTQLACKGDEVRVEDAKGEENDLRWFTKRFAPATEEEFLAQKPEPYVNPFKVGDWVRCVDPSGFNSSGLDTKTVYRVAKVNDDLIGLEGIRDGAAVFAAKRFQHQGRAELTVAGVKIEVNAFPLPGFDHEIDCIYKKHINKYQQSRADQLEAIDKLLTSDRQNIRDLQEDVRNKDKRIKELNGKVIAYEQMLSNVRHVVGKAA